ncbi:MAG: peptide chain release factor N(5)-glutamine methyltransferase [Chitinophagales bacterium]
MTIDGANRRLISSLGTIYDEREASSIASLVMEKLTGESKSLRVIHKLHELPEEKEILFRKWFEELMLNRPVQYVLGEAWFAGLRFSVDERVLIPRPETEELVAWVLEDLEPLLTEDFKILDIGTGTGCIPVSIGKKRKDLRLLACDFSIPALEVARKNSQDNQVPVEFIYADILNNSSRSLIPAVNMIISNPPYIPGKQRAALDKHVRNFEPEIALFVPDKDPIVFYKQIGLLAKKKLIAGGKVFLETHHDYSKAVLTWYQENGFTVELRKDFSGKNRIIRAII